MKDVAYFVGSCLSEKDCSDLEEEILQFYFAELRIALSQSEISVEKLEQEWRSLYRVAWADFQRFILGWSPQHRKLTAYSDALTERSINLIQEELLSAAREACLAAGALIETQRDQVLEVSSKGLPSPKRPPRISQPPQTALGPAGAP